LLQVTHVSYLPRRRTPLSRKFFAFSYKPKDGSSRTRVALWRALKELGAVYLQQGVALLPKSAILRGGLEALKEKVVSGGGSATLSELSFIEQADEDAIVGEFEASMRAEYGEVEENCASFDEELKRTRGRGEYNFAELEEAGWEVAKLERWFLRAAGRDYFGEPSRAAAEAALKTARKKLAAYERDVCSKDKHNRR
jgi:hypothetical protein